MMRHFMMGQGCVGSLRQHSTVVKFLLVLNCHCQDVLVERPSVIWRLRGLQYFVFVTYLLLLILEDIDIDVVCDA